MYNTSHFFVRCSERMALCDCCIALFNGLLGIVEELWKSTLRSLFLRGKLGGFDAEVLVNVPYIWVLRQPLPRKPYSSLITILKYMNWISKSGVAHFKNPN